MSVSKILRTVFAVMILKRFSRLRPEPVDNRYIKRTRGKCGKRGQRRLCLCREALRPIASTPAMPKSSRTTAASSSVS